MEFLELLPGRQLQGRAEWALCFCACHPPPPRKERVAELELGVGIPMGPVWTQDPGGGMTLD